MATYAIGDIQGCFDTLQRLLDRIEFNPDEDQLWVVGDLVNRGPRSLEVLRWAKSLGDSLVTVLGNHDFHLLGLVAGLRKKKSKDTLGPILEAEDGVELIEWLRHRPMIHQQDGFVMVHAGLHPKWSLENAVELAAEVETMLRSDDWMSEFAAVYGKHKSLEWILD